MKVLVVGGGGREHALCWKIASSPLVEEVLCAPGNAGTESVARNVAVSTSDIDGLVRLAKSEEIGLVVVGPEDPLVAGLADRLREAGITTFGPGAAGARLEGSKVFTKELLDRHRIPTGTWRRFDRAGQAKAYLEAVTTWPQVIKADGLASGKGVFVVSDAAEGSTVVDRIMEERTLGSAGNEVVIEEFLEGQELSIQAITDGRTLLVLDPAVDHKQVGEGDTGPNTGGMGVVAPVPWVSRRLMRQVEQRVLLPALHALQIEDVPFRGVLYAGLMVGDQGPRVLEFNVRFGDPETQVVMRRMKSDLVPYLVAAAEGRLEDCESPEWNEGGCVGVIGAAAGYPGEVRTGDVVTGIAAANAEEGVVVFHGGTKRHGDHVVTSGGRVLCATAVGSDVEEARRRSYAGLERIFWEGKFCRRDIGQR
ncbi:phosphoribosylamine--glycine ligase [Engelhardtia mirabilis]|uniref:Phosphoribosylamine--glycine ligase n=1 Tax=Engelhardtia mirabilis TaxID=2528011 RepID=A0A518BK30_9BACT|nr:Phosphoribosylamine--glycine ligase [Planctomycetes bacterium Pla133]QDV01658.1 Phosphoribosylamine--glycine ligase [Planctomycetes bacterium Pla86]